MSRERQLRGGGSGAGAAARCRHCGSVFEPEGGELFCSEACRVVHERIVAGGLEGFYRLSEGGRAPVDARIFHPEETGWLGEAQRRAEEEAAARGSAPEAECGIEGITCLGCVWLVEELFKREPGAVECAVWAGRGRVVFRWRPGEGLDLADFGRRLQGFGYRLAPLGAAGRGGEGELDGLTRRLGVCAALAMNTMLFTLPHYLGMPAEDPLARVMDPVTFGLATGSLAVGGSYFFRRAWAGLRAGVAAIDLPIAIGLAAAWAGSVFAWQAGRRDLFYFDFVAMFTFLMLAGRWTQERAAGAARRALERGGFRPGPVIDRETGVVREDVAGAGLEAGKVYGVPPGGTVPVRSLAREGPAELRLDWINGEPEPRVFPPGALVPSGAGVIGSRPVWFEALEGWEGSRLAALLAARADFAGRPGRMAGRVVRAALAGVLALGFAAGLYHLLTRGPADALQVFVSVLVVSCPCAIGVAIPLCDELAAGAARRRGVIIRDPAVWSRLGETRTVCFDKTGTLTRETPELENREALEGLDAGARRVLLAMTWRSLHPAAAALREALIAGGTETGAAAEGAEERAGLGIEWRGPDGVVWRLGRAGWSGPAEAGAGSVFSRDGKALACFRFAETLRPETAGMIRDLRERGLEVALLSGDDPERVGRLAERLGIAEAEGGLSPEGKAAWIRQRGRERVLMIGDGGNDNLAFKEAGCRGTPAGERGLLERNADFYIAGDRVGGVAWLFEVMERRRRTIRRLAVFTTCYNIGVLVPAVAGWMSPLLAAVLMPASSLIALGLAAAGLRQRGREGG